MIEEIQNLYLSLGKWGCYELSIMYVAELENMTSMADPLRQHTINLHLGFVDSLCVVQNAGGMMESLCGGKWICLKAGNGTDSVGRAFDLPLDYTIGTHEHDIHRYIRTVENEPGHKVEIGHFFYAGPGKLFDSCGNSLTRKSGKLVSRRILRKIA